MGDLKAVIDSLLKAKDAAALIKDANDRIPLQLEIYYQLAVAYNSKGYVCVIMSVTNSVSVHRVKKNRNNGSTNA